MASVTAKGAEKAQGRYYIDLEMANPVGENRPYMKRDGS